MPWRPDVPFATVGATLLLLSAGAAPGEPAVPNEIAIPPGHRLLLRAEGKGVQVYKAATRDGKLEWVFEAPLADLLDDKGERVGYHYDGPSWEAFDGSKVVRDEAEPVKSTPAPDPQKDIPWLLVKLKAVGGHVATLTPAVYVQRTRTSGGKAPTDSPRLPGTRVGVTYTAT
jgi:hypothetical protein